LVDKLVIYFIYLLYSANYFSLLSYEADALPFKFSFLLQFGRLTAMFRGSSRIMSNFLKLHKIKL